MQRTGSRIRFATLIIVITLIPTTRTALSGRAQQGASVQNEPKVTVPGVVKNYIPVTDAMLRNALAADWLMIRRDYQATNYSPLAEITTDNVKNLHLQWSWAMVDGGPDPRPSGATTQAAPIVHNGEIYLNNFANFLQAIDGR